MAPDTTPAQRWMAALSVFVLAALAFALPWDVFQRIPYTPLTVVKLAGGIVVVVAVLLLLSRQRTVPRMGLEWPFLIFAAGCVFSTAVSVAPENSTRQLVLFTAYGGFIYSAALLVRSTGVASRLLMTYYVAALCVALLTFLCRAHLLWPAHWKPTTFPYSTSLLEMALTGADMRMAAASPDLNQGALLLAVAFAVGLYIWNWRGLPGTGRIIFVICQGMLVGAIAIGQSRSALAAVAVLAAFVMVGAIYRRSKATAAGLVVVGVIAVLTLWQWAPARDWVLREDDSVSSRTWAYRAALELLPQYGLTGVGLDAADRVIADSAYGSQVDGMAIHNVPLKLALETGVVGVAGYILMWMSLCVMLWRAATRAGASELRLLARAGLAAAFVVLSMQMVQPFVALPVFPFLIAVVVGPIRAVRAGATSAQHLNPRVVYAAAGLVLALVVLNQTIYQRDWTRAAAYSGTMGQAAQFHRSGQWEQAAAMYAWARALASGVNETRNVRKGPPLDALPFHDVAETVTDPFYSYRLLHLDFAHPRPEAAVAYAVGSLALSRGDVTTAGEALARAIELEPEFAQAHYVLAETLWAQGAREAALTAYARAARHAETWRNREFRERMSVIDARIALLKDSTDAGAEAERIYWMRKRGRLPVAAE